MATTVMISSIVGTTVNFTVVSTVTYTDIYVAAVEHGTGDELFSTTLPFAGSYSAPVGANTAFYDLIIALLDSGVIVGSAPAVQLTPSNFASRMTYIGFAQVSQVDVYNIYANDITPATAPVLLGTAVVPFFRDPTVYASEAAAKNVRYRVFAVIDGVECETPVTEMTRHEMPTCLLTGRVTDIFGQALFVEPVAFLPMTHVRGQPRGARRQQLYNRVLTERAIRMIPSRDGWVGGYFLQNARLSFQRCGDPFQQFDFVVPQQAAADMLNLNLVNRVTADY